MSNKIIKYETNPFIKELGGKMFIQPRANMIIGKSEALINKETGEILKDSAIIGRQKLVDKSQFAKIYIKNIGQMLELKANSIKVLMYLTNKMDYESKSFLNYNSQFKKVGYKSAVTVFNALRELIKNNVIAASIMPHFYWMNPMYICKGERFSIYTEYVVKEKGGSYGEAVKNVMGNENANKQLPLFSSDNEKIDPYANEKDKNE